ncbi:MAG: hypothetical protein OHK0013_16830 [Sandaracinaceae bacterium]
MSVARALPLFLAALLAAWAIRPAEARAQVPERRVGVRFVDGVPHVDVSVADFASDPETRRKLESGLPQTLVLRTYAYVDGVEAPIAVAARSCRVVYDLWETRFRVQIASEAGDRSTTVASVEDVITRCLVASRLSVGTAAAWTSHRGRRAYFAILAELNPLTPDTVQRIRRWIAHPQRGRVDRDSFFGSFVSLFVNRSIGAAERSLSFRSQELLVP